MCTMPCRRRPSSSTKMPNGRIDCAVQAPCPRGRAARESVASGPRDREAHVHYRAVYAADLWRCLVGKAAPVHVRRRLVEHRTARPDAAAQRTPCSTAAKVRRASAGREAQLSESAPPSGAVVTLASPRAAAVPSGAAAVPPRAAAVSAGAAAAPAPWAAAAAAVPLAPHVRRPAGHGGSECRRNVGSPLSAPQCTMLVVCSSTAHASRSFSNRHSSSGPRTYVNNDRAASLRVLEYKHEQTWCDTFKAH